MKSGHVKNSPPRGATHFKMAHFALQNKQTNKQNKDNMKRSVITDQVNVFFPFERIITIIIIVMLCRYRRTSQNPLDNCKRLVDTRNLHFGNKTVKIYQKLHHNTNQKKAKGSDPNKDDLN